MPNNNNNFVKDQIPDAEIVSSTNPTDNSAQLMLDLEQLIKNGVAQIDKLKTESKTHQEMLNDIFLNDSTFCKHQEEVKKATKIRNATKQEILKKPEAGNLNSKLKETKAEIKEINNSLSEYLREYQRMSGVNEIETADGEVREIVYTAKLVKKSANFR